MAPVNWEPRVVSGPKTTPLRNVLPSEILSNFPSVPGVKPVYNLSSREETRW
jgi:hypothetical protein